MRTASDTSVSIYPQYVVSYPSWTSVNSLVYVALTLHSDLCNQDDSDLLVYSMAQTIRPYSGIV